jgi:hypothetical protein
MTGLAPVPHLDLLFDSHPEAIAGVGAVRRLLAAVGSSSLHAHESNRPLSSWLLAWAAALDQGYALASLSSPARRGIKST